VIFITAISANLHEGLFELFNILNTKTRFISNNFKTLGSACGTNTTCPAFGQCDFGYCNTSTNMCVPSQTVPVGAACGPAYDICAAGSVCVYNISSGICTARKQYLCSCDFTATVGNTQEDQTCDTNLCVQGKCDFLRHAGATCTQNYECFSNSCMNNLCTNNKNYGDNCTRNVDACPSDAYCPNAGVCTKYALLGGNCTNANCGAAAYCDTVLKTCQSSFTAGVGQSCNSGNSGQCVSSATCVGGMCVAKQNGLPCNNYNCSGTCSCTNGQTSCQLYNFANCDSSLSSYDSCINNNCYTDFGTFSYAGDSCVMKNCRSQISSAFCCLYGNQNASPAIASILSYFDCSKNKFIGSPCDPNSAPLMSASFVTLFVALLYVLLV